MGAPDMAWFFDPGGSSLTATQIDFVWGVFNARCQTPAETGSACARYPDAPTIVEAQ